MDAIPINAGFWAIPVGLALAFGFSNGFRDSSTIVATVVSTGSLSPTAAFALCGVFEFLGALFVGHAIAATMMSAISGPAGLPPPAQLSMILTAALAAALAWGTFSWWRAWPTSNGQALVGGLVGAGWIVREGAAPLDPTLGIVFAVLVASPMLGFAISSAVTRALRHAGEWMTPRVRPHARAAHVLGCLAVSTAHGSNDGQMIVALVALAMAGTADVTPGEAVPLALRLSVAAALTAGVLFGGRRILRKLGMKFYRIRDVQGVGAQISAAGTILACGALGFPASTTQVMSGSIVGAGVAKNPRSVRWLLVREIVLSWVVTLPVTAVLAGLVAKILMRWGNS